MGVVAERSSVPVPSTPWLVESDGWVGSPFLVMGRLDEVAPTDVPSYVFGGWLVELGLVGQAELQSNVVGVLAALHAITPPSADLEFLARPQFGASALDQHLGYQRWYYEWARAGVRYPLIERAFA